MFAIVAFRVAWNWHLNWNYFRVGRLVLETGVKLKLPNLLVQTYFSSLASFETSITVLDDEYGVLLSSIL
jgi:hypothetical protein